MEETLNNHSIEQALVRVSYFILSSARKDVKFEEIIDCFSSTLSEQIIKVSLRTDPHNRFIITGSEAEDGDFIIQLARITDGERAIQDGMERWRSTIALFFDQNPSPAELGRITSFVQRPSVVPRDVKIKDVLRTDPLNRFRIYGESNCLYVARVLSPLEDDHYREIWRLRIIEFIVAQERRVSLSLIGSNTTKPFQLGGKAKLIEVLRTDPFNRFSLSSVTSNSEILVGLIPTDENVRIFCEKWRFQIAKYLVTEQKSVYLTELGTKCSRPGLLPRGISLQEVLAEDPLHRFKIVGTLNRIKVKLVNKHGGHSQSKSFLDNSTHSMQSTGSNSSKTEGGSDSSCDGMNNAGTSPTNFNILESMGLFAPPRRSNSLSDFKADDDDVSSSIFNNFYPQKEMMPSNNLYSQVPINHSGIPRGGESWSPFSLENQSQTFIDTGISLTRNVDSSFESIGAPPGLGYPRSQVWPKDSSALTHIFNVLGGNNGTCTSETSEEESSLPAREVCANTGPSAGTSLERNGDKYWSPTKHVWLQDWLPVIFEGFPDSMIDSFCANLTAEGFASVQDLIVANAMGQLTFEFLKDYGFKIGHYNRLVTNITSFEDSK